MWFVQLRSLYLSIMVQFHNEGKKDMHHPPLPNSEELPFDKWTWTWKETANHLLEIMLLQLFHDR